MTAVKNKETVYVDVDDEITSIIDKVKTSQGKIVALVLPKRATVLQSVVNMKLLKRAAVNSKKNLVLITSEAGLLPLAGAAGLHVAKSLQSKPVIPPLPKMSGATDDEPDLISESDDQIDLKASVGELAAAAAISPDDETETIELGDIDVEEPKAATMAAGAKKKLKHLKVPNFERFRLGFFLAGLGIVLLIVGWFVAYIVMPKANITIKTNTTSVVSSFDFTASTAVTELDTEAKKIPATLKELTKTDSEKGQATGQKDMGTKASGTMTLRNCSDADGSVVIPANTVFSSGSFNFISDEAVTLPESSFSGGGTCKTETRNVDVTAANAGDNYNLSSRNYTTSIEDIQATGSSMTGGVSKIVKVVSQDDIDAALARMKSRLDKQAEDELKALLDTESLFALNESKKIGEPKVAAKPALNEEATEFTLTSETVYSMLGVKREDISTIIALDVEDEIDTERQVITNDGIDTAVMRLNTQPSNGEASISFRTSVVAGPELDEVAIKEAVRGKKRGEVEQYIGGQPGVREVVVEYSPFWVYTTPKAAKKISITVEKTDDTQSDNQDTNESE